MNERSGDDSDQPHAGLGRRRSGLGSRRVLTISFGISIVLHLLLISIYPVVQPEPDVEPRVSTPDEEDFSRALEVLRLMEITIAEAGRPDAPEDIEELDEPVLTPEPIDLAPPTAIDLAPPPPSGGDRLAPRLSVEELWRPIDPTIIDLDFEQREELDLGARIAEWYDSLAAEEAFERKFTDWTYTDDEGRRWGVADGRIYLGDVVLPGQHLFAVPVGRRDEYNEMVWQWNQMQLQQSRAAVIETWKERQQAIRERRDRERAAQRDTTRRGGR